VGRNSSGVRGIRLMPDDHVVGMVVADPQASLLTVCGNGYGKRTPFGPNSDDPGLPATDGEGVEPLDGAEIADEPVVEDESADSPADEPAESEEEESVSSQRSYRTQGRGGKGVRDIKTTERNGPVIGIAHVDDGDEVMMITARGQIQRIPVNDINIIGRNTQGVRIMNLDEADRLVAIKRVPHEEGNGKSEAEAGTEEPGDAGAAATEPGPAAADGGS